MAAPVIRLDWRVIGLDQDLGGPGAQMTLPDMEMIHMGLLWLANQKRVVDLGLGPTGLCTRLDCTPALPHFIWNSQARAIKVGRGTSNNTIRG